MDESPLYLIDGTGFIFRAFHALPPLTRPLDGLPVGAVLGVCAMLVKLSPQMDKARTLAIFDSGKPNFRHELYPLYKANRSTPPDDLKAQFGLCEEACTAFGITVVRADEGEADDLIASYATHYSKLDKKIIIISSDKDLMHLMSDQIALYDPIKHKYVTDQDVLLKFGVPPEKIVEVQALCGDSADNIPGVRGIGPKTAATLIHDFGSVAQLLLGFKTIARPKLRDMIKNSLSDLKISYQLVTLKRDCRLPISYDDIAPFSRVTAQTQNALNFLKQNGFHALLKRVGDIPSELSQIPNTSGQNSDSTHVIITQADDFSAFWTQATYNKIITVEWQPSRSAVNFFSLKTMIVSTKNDVGIIQTVSCDLSAIGYEYALSHLRSAIVDSSVHFISSYLKYLIKITGATPSFCNDPTLMSYILHAGEHGHDLEELARLYLERSTLSEIERSSVSLMLALKFDDLLCQNSKLQSLYESIERPLIPVLVRMEQRGVYVNPNTLKTLRTEFQDMITELSEAIYAEAGQKFLISSVKQLGLMLFETLKMPLPKKGKSGSYTTDSDTLSALVQMGYRLPELILKWRTLSKLLQTYVEGLSSQISTDTARVHTSFSMITTTTGRLSSSDPNLQNIPIKTEHGRKIRACFEAAPGFTLVSLDYSQIELRLLAHFASIPKLKHAFLNNIDIHTQTAADLYGIPVSKVTLEQRRQAKTINFGIIYGISAFGLAKQLAISSKEAATMIESYFEKYPGIKDYMSTQVEFAQKNGYVETLKKRRCHVPGIWDSNSVITQFAVRQTINAPLQGSNADIIKKAMISIDHLITKNKWDTRLILQIHDELLFEVPSSELDSVPPILKNTMEQCVQLTIPLKVDMKTGNSWDFT